jgi:hypothetical protein
VAFRVYRDLGPSRTLEAIGGEHPMRLLRRWRAEHGWEARCRAWDIEVHRLDDQRRLDLIRSMDETHQKTARILIAAGMRALQGVEQLTPHQAARFVELGTRLERTALLGGHLEPPATLVPVDTDDGLSPLERIARDLLDTA